MVEPADIDWKNLDFYVDGRISKRVLDTDILVCPVMYEKMQKAGFSMRLIKTYKGMNKNYRTKKLKDQILRIGKRRLEQEELIEFRTQLDETLKSDGPWYVIGEDFIAMNLSPKSQKRSRLCRK